MCKAPRARPSRCAGRHGNVVVHCPFDTLVDGKDVTTQWLLEEQKKLSKWRKSIHRRVAALAKGEWVTVKAASGPMRSIGICKWCNRPLRCRPDLGICSCECRRCEVTDEHEDCYKLCREKGRRCKVKYVAVYDCVVVCSVAMVPRRKLNYKAMAATNAIVSCELILMARKMSSGTWRSVPLDVTLMILNLVLWPHKLRLRRRYAVYEV